MTCQVVGCERPATWREVIRRADFRGVVMVCEECRHAIHAPGGGAKPLAFETEETDVPRGRTKDRAATVLSVPPVDESAGDDAEGTL